MSIKEKIRDYKLRHLKIGRGKKRILFEKNGTIE